MDHLNAYLRSEEGISFVHDRDVAQIDRLLSGVAQQLRTTTLYRTSPADDQVRLAAVVMKLQNQSGSTWTPRIIRDMDNGRLTSVEQVNRTVDDLRKDGIRTDYVESGRVHTSHAAEVLIDLRNADPRSPLAGAWAAVVADPMVNPTQLDRVPARPDLPHQYASVKTLFLQPNQAPRLIEAMDEGGSYAWGRPQAERGNAPTAGLYAAGDDLVLWNLEGEGVRHVDGQWSAVSRDRLSRTRHAGGIVDLFEDTAQQTRTLMHVDPGAPPLRPPGVDPRRVGADGDPTPSTSTGGETGARAETTGHPLLDQARAGVHRLDRELGRTPDEASERMSASLAVLAQSRGLTRIDHVVLSAQTDALGKGANVFVIQGEPSDPARRVGHMRTHDAIAATVEQSLERLADRTQAASPQPAMPAPAEREPAQVARA
ncbi:XVIPCD domain-containing protein [Lysobacter sp. A3-1-A15]|uniref:XVIPCD domain-containing protein n=1 Tax=Novilysobacter viscosus TaxID=3098602 RepID=UPI002EDB3898